MVGTLKQNCSAQDLSTACSVLKRPSTTRSLDRFTTISSSMIGCYDPCTNVGASAATKEVIRQKELTQPVFDVGHGRMKGRMDPFPSAIVFIRPSGCTSTEVFNIAPPPAHTHQTHAAAARSAPPSSSVRLCPWVGGACHPASSAS